MLIDLNYRSITTGNIDENKFNESVELEDGLKGINMVDAIVSGRGFPFEIRTVSVARTNTRVDLLLRIAVFYHDAYIKVELAGLNLNFNG